MSNLTYDKNGNIETLDRKGASGTNKDQLAYHYQANQLQYIDDTWDDAAGFVDGNTSGADYAYDSSGNLTQDLNKNIGSISYNHLNLPTEVLLNVPEGPDKLTYTYSAGGRKLKMQVWEGTTLVKTIDYAGAYHYENDQLTYVHNEEGRIVVDAQGKVDYQVYLTDHQGNTRRVISTVVEVYESVEDMEGDVYKGFSSIPKVTNVNANSTTGGNKVGVLNSGETGALIFLKMDKGDTVDLSVVANYETAPSGSTFLGTGYSALFGAFDQSFGSGVENGVSSSATDFSTALSGVAMAGKSGNAGTAPKAYLNYIIFDREMNYEHAGFIQISTTAQGIGSQEAISLDDIIAGQAGYLLAYLSNENQEPVAVNFDDFTVRHAKTNVVQAVDYYPFGMEAVSYTRTAADPNQYLYNEEAELNDLTGYYETFYRNYDASIGRFHSIDPVASKYGSLTPYNYAFNDPVFWNDPLGDDPGGDGPFERVEGERNSLNGGGDFGWNQFISRLTGNHWGTFARYGVHGADYGNPYAEESSLYWDYVGYQHEMALAGNASAQEYLGFEPAEWGYYEDFQTFHSFFGSEYQGTSTFSYGSTGSGIGTPLWGQFTQYDASGNIIAGATQLWVEGNRPQANGGAGTSDDYLLAKLYLHFQVGGGDPLTLDMSSINFGDATQSDLGLSGMKVGDVRAVNLFNAGPLNQAALAFGRANMMAHGNNQFSIVSDGSSRFDFAPLIDTNASLGRNAGNVLGAAINYNVIPSLIFNSPIPTAIPLIFGGPFNVNFNGTKSIPK